MQPAHREVSHNREAPRTKWAPLLVGAATVAAIIGGGAWLGIAEDRRQTRTDGLVVHRVELSPQQSPRPIAAFAAPLPEEAPVIGVVAGECARAYSLDAFKDVEDHVLNDVLGGWPLTVTYCPQNGCARVFTSSRGSEPLDIAVGGWVGQPGPEPDVGSVMLLRIGFERYFQDTGESLGGTGEFPFQQSEPEKTTWGKWRSRHPETDVVVPAAEKQNRGARP